MDKKYTVIGIGEILWDLLPDGKMLGGAPINFAYHASQLGAVGVAISSVGKDELGREILKSVDTKGVVNCISVNKYPTGTVGVILKDGIADYTIYENVAWDFIELSKVSTIMLQQADAICFGTLAQRNIVSHDAIMTALKLVPEKCLKVYDINLRQKYYNADLISKSLISSNVFKINDDEIELFKHLFKMDGNEVELSQKIMKTYSIEYLALTKGDKGSYLFWKDDISFMPTPVVDVEDTIGAGDSFTSALVMGILNNLPIKEIHRKAVEISAFVCTQKGATPVLNESLLI
jgi:fructokinase